MRPVPLPAVFLALTFPLAALSAPDALAAPVPAPAVSPSLSAGQPLPGFGCASLPEAVRRMPPVYDRPHGRAVALAGATVIVSPHAMVDGYLQLLLPSGQYAWIEAYKLKPWRSASNPKATCTPSVLSNGLPGFRFG